MSPTAYAKHRGLDLSTIKHYINEGTLEGAWKYGPNNRKIIFKNEADKILDHDGSEDEAKEESTEKKEATTRNGKHLTNARTAKTTIEAQIAKIKYEKLKGSLVDKEVVVKVAKEMASLTKQSMLTLPDRLSPLLAAESDQDKIYNILTEEVHLALRNLSQENYSFFSDGSSDE